MAEFMDGKWVGNENCYDPLKQFEQAVHKLEDLVDSLQYNYFSYR